MSRPLSNPLSVKKDTHGLSLIWPFLLLAGLLAFQANLGTRISTLRAAPLPKERRTASLISGWTPAWLRLISLGQSQTAVDYLLIQALLSREVAPLGSARSDAFGYLDLASNVDPAYFELVQNGAMFLTASVQDSRGAVLLAARGNDWRRKVLPTMPESFRQRFWRNSWSIPLITGYLQLFEFHDLPAAAEAFVQAGSDPLAPGHIKSMAERFRKPGGVYEVGIRVLGFLLPATPEGAPRDKLLRSRAMLMVHFELWRLNQLLQGSSKSKERIWRKLLDEDRVPRRDSMGGSLFFDPEAGAVRTTTPLEKVFGVS